MIETLPGFPDSVVAMSAKGRVTRKDYEEVLIPKVNEAFGRRGKVRCYYELGSAFSGMDPGAAWEDFKLGIEHLRGWERVAIVTDVDWIRRAISAFRFLLPGQITVFETRQAAEARRWITADLAA
jgi:SpoIIAA-like